VVPEQGAMLFNKYKTTMRIISAETSLVGVIGHPISHSLSPVMHNAALQEMNLNWCYLAIPCETKNLKQVIHALRAIDCKGLNITIPHKEKSLLMCKEISYAANEIGAINTLIPNLDGSWNGDNTDVEGFISPLKLKDWNKKKAILLGSGGSARAVITGLKLLNFKEIIVVGRQSNKLQLFINDMSSEYENSKNFSPLIKGILEHDVELIEYIKNADLIVNATPVGMNKNTKYNLDSINIPLGEEIWKNLENTTTLYDLIYTPRPTPWLLNAAKKGCNTIDGLEMLVQQGAASMKLWSGFKEIPIEIMRQAAKNHLKNYS
tara:strand:- start:8190 stop:9149 length:960 start_codon:yes stop_codon:yes gene_type:complete